MGVDGTEEASLCGAGRWSWDGSTTDGDSERSSSDHFLVCIIAPSETRGGSEQRTDTLRQTQDDGVVRGDQCVLDKSGIEGFSASSNYDWTRHATI